MSTSELVMRGHSNVLSSGVRVVVESLYLEQHSKPERDRYLFVYLVKITNEGPRPVQLLDRHWVITDAYGHTEEVRGPGVIGETPLLAPKSSHTYRSFCPLSTPWGAMEGSYGMVDMEGEHFRVTVGRFDLISPEVVH